MLYRSGTWQKDPEEMLCDIFSRSGVCSLGVGRGKAGDMQEKYSGLRLSSSPRGPLNLSHKDAFSMGGDFDECSKCRDLRPTRVG